MTHRQLHRVPACCALPSVTLLLAVLLCHSVAVSAETPSPADPAPADRGPEDIGPLVVAHATALAAMGPRPASSAGELQATGYVEARLRSLGLEVAREPFTFTDFEVRSTDLVLAGKQVEPIVLGIDPFNGSLQIEGEAALLAAATGEPDSEDLAGRLVITDHPMAQFLIADRSPRAVVCIGADDFAAFAGQNDRSASLRVVGSTRERGSANLIATLRGTDTERRRLLVTAHLDAYRDSPGANDNGTGLGALIELARIFAAVERGVEMPITFVAFGAEEVGAVGSRTYVERHVGELPDVVAVVNLDTLGGHDGPQIGTNEGVDGPAPGPRGIAIPGELVGKGWEGLDGRWRMLHPEVLSLVTRSHSPEWLERAVSAATADAGVEVGRRNLISDHRSFAQAGVPATSIQSGKHTIHSPEDTADRLDAANVGEACAVAAALIRRLAAGTDLEPAS